jgi:hypothetical protein
MLALPEAPRARPISYREADATCAVASPSLERGMVAAQPPVVELLSVEKLFPDGTRALATINLTISAGEFVTLI